jgi:hypothetical protein
MFRWRGNKLFSHTFTYFKWARLGGWFEYTLLSPNYLFSGPFLVSRTGDVG